jgi:ABC-type branched-subunit amino acid transport system ATPase component
MDVLDVLSGRGIFVAFDGIRALRQVDFVLNRDEILGLIGPNGAGKTTLVNVLSGFYRPSGGRVFLGAVDVTGGPPEFVTRMGLARTFQNLRLFGRLSVFENVELGAVGLSVGRREARRRSWELLERMNLASLSEVPAEQLPHGDARRVGLARALASHPRFLLVDEPAAGLNEVETDELMRLIASIRDDFRCGIVVIEHDMRVIMGLCERIHVLSEGDTIKIGSPSDVRADPAVISAYLGQESRDAHH